MHQDHLIKSQGCQQSLSECSPWAWGSDNSLHLAPLKNGAFFMRLLPTVHVPSQFIVSLSLWNVRNETQANTLTLASHQCFHRKRLHLMLQMVCVHATSAVCVVVVLRAACTPAAKRQLLCHIAHRCEKGNLLRVKRAAGSGGWRQPHGSRRGNFGGG